MFPSCGDDRFAPYLTCSCADRDGVDSLEGAQRANLDAAFDSLELEEGASFLDVGCGWGSLTDGRGPKAR